MPVEIAVFIGLRGSLLEDARVVRRSGRTT